MHIVSPLKSRHLMVLTVLVQDPQNITLRGCNSTVEIIVAQKWIHA